MCGIAYLWHCICVALHICGIAYVWHCIFVALYISAIELCGSIVFKTFLYIIQFCVTPATPDMSSERENFIPQMEYLREGTFMRESDHRILIFVRPLRAKIEIFKKYSKTNKETNKKQKAKQTKVSTSCTTKLGI